jgi:uncharacterized membrane protein
MEWLKKLPSPLKGGVIGGIIAILFLIIEELFFLDSPSSRLAYMLYSTYNFVDFEVALLSLVLARIILFIFFGIIIWKRLELKKKK